MRKGEYKYPIGRDGKAAQSEHRLQADCVTWFRLRYPELGKLLFAIPNGGMRSKATGAKLKEEGMLRGVPDLFFACPSPNKGWHGMFIEMKNGTAPRATKEQEELMEMYTRRGYYCRLCRSFDEFMDIMEKYLA